MDKRTGFTYITFLVLLAVAVVGSAAILTQIRRPYTPPAITSQDIAEPGNTVQDGSRTEECGSEPPALCASNTILTCKDGKWMCENSAPGIPADWQTYRNEQYGFEVKYPPDWSASRDGIQLELDIANANMRVSVLDFRPPSTGKFQDWVNERPYALTKLNGNDVLRWYQRGPATPGGDPYYAQEHYLIPSVAKDWAVAIDMMIKDTRTCTDCVEIFEGVASTFKFISQVDKSGTGLTAKEASKVLSAEQIVLSATITNEGVVLEWQDLGESSRGAYVYYTHYNVYRRLFSNENRQLIDRVEVKKDYHGPYRFVDGEVTPGNRYSYEIVQALVSGKYQEEHSKSNIVDVAR